MDADKLKDFQAHIIHSLVLMKKNNITNT